MFLLHFESDYLKKKALLTKKKDFLTSVETVTFKFFNFP